MRVQGSNRPCRETRKGNCSEGWLSNNLKMGEVLKASLISDQRILTLKKAGSLGSCGKEKVDVEIWQHRLIRSSHQKKNRLLSLDEIDVQEKEYQCDETGFTRGGSGLRRALGPEGYCRKRRKPAERRIHLPRNVFSSPELGESFVLK